MPSQMPYYNMNCSSTSLFFSDAESICKGTAFNVRSHSPLKALMSQLLNSEGLLANVFLLIEQLTIVHNPVRIVEEDTVVTVREHMDIVILHPSEVQLVK
jgi:hypothetical protein